MGETCETRKTTHITVTGMVRSREREMWGVFYSMVYGGADRGLTGAVSSRDRWMYIHREGGISGMATEGSIW